MCKQAISNSKAEQRPSPQALAIESGKEAFAVNVVSNLAFTFTQAVVSLWFTPYLIKNLGIAVYGIVPLANSITSYISLVTQSLNSAVNRFLIIDLAKGDEQTANATFNTALFGVIGLAVVLVPFILVFSLIFPNVFDIPPGSELDAQWLFFLVATAFLVSVIVSNFAVSAYAHSKFLLMNVVNFVALFARVGFVIVLFSLFTARLWHVGMSILITAVIGAIGFGLLWRKLTPELRVRIKCFDRSRLRSLMGMGGWAIVHKTGILLLNNIDLMVVNLAFNAETTGTYGSLMQFPVLVRVVANTTAGVLSPSVLKKYAQGDFTGLRRLTHQAIKLLGLVIALPVGLLCGFSRPFLSIWLGPSFRDSNVLLVFLVFHLGLNLSTLPLAYIQTAYNRVRWPGIVTLITGAANLGLAILLATWGQWGAVGVAIAGAVTWTLKNVLFTPVYTAHVMKLPWWVFFPSLSVSVVGTCFVGMMAYGVTLLRMPNGWFDLGVSVAVVSLLCGVIAFFVALDRDDWVLINNLSPLPIRHKLTRFLRGTNRI